MSCINSDGKLTQSATALLEAVQNDKHTPESLAKELGVPLFKVRSSLRDMSSMGFVEQIEDAYVVSEGGKKLLNKNK
ncbi:hypothetical protein [Texcoconibacillus texcoconensis]|uniref:DNA-binding IclR family transcriptional regulator n=1 Tax=Texcoconibacillus texcoconensis TaxID=1095777 RepID=A0A840QKC4_9BACI|nr:hypothetical protein [Texcoconibacillus texcoconensis]MBB5171906.1 DNA-binding IclR family transcriptional regulator [Texcoconibacillus texcoconensis]